MEHDFSELYMQYPAVIEQMPNPFNSHEFILALAHQNQRLYVEALYSYRESMHRGKPAPFMVVHGVLSRHLREFSELVEYIGDIESEDIFGDSTACAQWRKV